MMADRVRIHPAALRGPAHIPTSKSLCHRAILSAALSAGESRIDRVSFSEDIQATLRVAKAFGASFEIKEDSIFVRGIGGRIGSAKADLTLPVSLDCGESGSTLRFMIPIMAALGMPSLYSGSGKLPERPLGVYYDLFDEKGISYQNKNGKLPLLVKGTLEGGRYTVDGSVSSQFITGLLMALPLAEKDSTLTVAGKLESAPYVDLTLSVLQVFGIRIERLSETEFRIPGGQTYLRSRYAVETDASQAAFFVMAAGGCLKPLESILIPGMARNTAQGDKAFTEAFNAFGGHAVYEEDGLRVFGLSDLSADSRWFNAASCPDIVPILAVLGTILPGSLRITGCARLRIKESDRLEAITSGLSILGAHIKTDGDDLVIEGGYESVSRVVTVDSDNDHRIAMSLAVASLVSNRTIEIEGASCVNKSWPSFWKDMEAMFPGAVEYLS